MRICFTTLKSEDQIFIKLTGRGFETRQLAISRSRGDVIVPTKALGNRQQRRAARNKSFAAPVPSEALTVPIALTWTDENGNSHAVRALLSPQGLVFEGTNERLPTSFMFASQTVINASEAAGHFSALRKNRTVDRFRQVFLSVFNQIKDIDLADIGGNSILVADVPWAKELLPLPLLSGGTNRAAAILLSLTHRDDGLVLVDEIENGIFHARQRSFSKALLELTRAYRQQLFLTTHSEEWLRNLIEAAGNQVKDISFWRLERKNKGPTIRRFTVAEFQSGMAAGEMR